MEGRISITVIVVFWLITMTWLMWTKVLPPLLVGEPPDYRAIVDDHDVDSPPSAWIVSYNGKPFGVAANRMESTDEMSRIFSFVEFDRLPIDDVPFLPDAVKQRFPQLLSSAVQSRSSLLIDSLGRLVDFESQLRMNDTEILRLHGVVHGSKMRVSVSSSFIGQRKRFEIPLDANALIGDQLSPQDRLPGLHVGQQWTAPVFSVMRALLQQGSESPIEITRAQVVREELISVGGKKVSTLLVVLGADVGSGDREEKGRLWVDQRGMVVRQEMALPFGAKLRFERCDHATSAEIFERIQRGWHDKRRRAKDAPAVTGVGI